ncbi:MAG: undecaprenyl-phosphate glucose phosphotransferase [Anaerolineae bacterium]|jgi:exopolysaccharide biosynthesis polyprenyl glycosylphosphotransferase|nr:undecaprenyl-phosphate glucose phosphotransferase [Anaerolineae bacterium]
MNRPPTPAKRPSAKLSTLEIPKVVDSARASRIKTGLNLLLGVIDTSMLTLAFLLGYEIRRAQFEAEITTPYPSLERYLLLMVFHIAAILALLYAGRLYHARRSFSRFDHARQVIGNITIGAVFIFGVYDLLFKGTALDIDYPRAMFFYIWLLSVVLVLAGREFHRALLRIARVRKVAADNLLIVGSSKVAQDLLSSIRSRPDLGYNVVGVVDRQANSRERVKDVAFLGEYHELPKIIDEYQIEQVIIALPDDRRADLPDIVALCQRGRVDIKVLPDVFAYMAGDMNVDDLGGTPLLTVRDIALRGWKLSVKRAMDILGALGGLIFLSPFMLLTALIIRLDSPGPVFHTQERMGLDGRPFPMIKFRSMRTDAEKGNQPGWTVKNDPRVTRVGKVIRKLNWDEIPQLINILLGHMSLVGPRPERPQYVQEFRQNIPRYMERHREKAGLTGWAQVNGLRGDTSISERTRYDLWYVENWSIWLDIKIIIRTAWQTVTRSSPNAY